MEPVTDGDTVRAAELIENSRRGRRSPDDARLSLGDGLCLAVAERLNLPVTGGDEYWSGVELRVQFMPSARRDRRSDSESAASRSSDPPRAAEGAAAEPPASDRPAAEPDVEASWPAGVCDGHDVIRRS